MTSATLSAGKASTEGVQTPSAYANTHGSGRRRHCLRRTVVLALAAAFLVGYTAVTGAYFVQPSLGTVVRPQAVVVLGGYGDRVARGFALASAEHVHTVAVSWPNYSSCPASQRGFRVLCFVPNPVSTQGEARAVARLARTYGWSRLLVVAGTTQVVRARMRLERCFSGRLAFSGVDPSGFFSWLYEIVYGQAALVKALVWQFGC